MWTFGVFKAQKERIIGHYPNDRSHTRTRQEAALCSISSAFIVTELLLTLKGWGWGGGVEVCAALLDNMCTELLIILKKLLTAFYTWRHVLPALIRLSGWNCFMQQKLGGAFPLIARLSSRIQLASRGGKSLLHSRIICAAVPQLFPPNLARKTGCFLKPLFHISHLVKSPQMKCLEKRGQFKQGGKKEKRSKGKNLEGVAISYSRSSQLAS